MSTTIDIVVPDLGDFEDVEVIELLVKAGETVELEDGLITLETDKAALDVPAPENGIIDELTVAVGDKVSSGSVIGRLKVGAGDTVVISPTTQHETTSETTALADTAQAAGDTQQPIGEQTLVVPDLGDFDDVEVIEVHIANGDVVAIEDPLVTLETDKAAMDVPATVAGRIESVLVKVGDKVSVGSSLALIDAVTDVDVAKELDHGTTQTRTDLPAVVLASVEPKATPTPSDSTAVNEAGFSRAHASPSVRKLARELGVDLTQASGTGAKKRILRDDVKAFVKALLRKQSAAHSGSALPKTPRIDFSKFGEVETVALTRIQKISGPRLQASWINLPHVTQHDLADITDLEQRRQELKGAAKERGISLTPLAFVIKAVTAALQEYPKINSSLADDGTSLHIKKYMHIGFAADTEQGLMVPVIRDAEQKDVYELAQELGELSALARDGKLKSDQLQGASFTISSLGGIGGTAFTPIVNAPEVAILGVSRSATQPVWNGTEFVPRLMLPLSLSYDHRVVDGAAAVRFTTFLGRQLADIESLLLATP